MPKTSFPSEAEEQRGFLQWFEPQFPGVLIYHIPNGGHRAMSEAKRLKAEGVKPGMPDLHIPIWNVWIEMKRIKGGKFSDDQMRMRDYLDGIGHTVIWANGARDASVKLLSVLQVRRGSHIP